MKIAFITDPLIEFKIYKDSTFVADARSGASWPSTVRLEPQEMALVQWCGARQSDANPLNWEPGALVFANEKKVIAVNEFDAVCGVKDPPFDMEYIYATYLLDIAESGARVFNKPSAIRDHNEKLSIAQFSQFTTPTLVTRDASRIRQFLRST